MNLRKRPKTPVVKLGSIRGASGLLGVLRTREICSRKKVEWIERIAWGRQNVVGDVVPIMIWTVGPWILKHVNPADNDDK